jgi:putative NADH-flavin reductase
LNKNKPIGLFNIIKKMNNKTKLNVVVISATGNAGQTVVNELINRGHEVTAVVRNPEKLSKGIKYVIDELNSIETISIAISGADVVVSAFGPSSSDPRYFSDESYTDQLVHLTQKLIAAVESQGIRRLIVLGGAGSLWFSPGVTVLDSGYWPKEYVPIAKSHVRAFAALKNSNVNWTYLSPPFLIENGVRTGKFRTGLDDLLVDVQGKSWISYEDFAVALVDELEEPTNERKRFTVGY